MSITRRQFLKRSAASAAALSLGPGFRWLPGTRVSYAAGPSDAIVVFVRQYGGNDGINTVYPLTGPQRTLYQKYRPTLGLPAGSGGPNGLTARAQAAGFGSTTPLDIGANDGSTYAFHPAMSALHNLYTAGRVAVVHGVHYPFADHSHFRSEAIWYGADPLGTGGVGWFGKYLNLFPALYPPSAVPGVMLEGDLVPLFTPANTGLFAFTDLAQLRFPATNELGLKQQAFTDLYTETQALALSPELLSLGNTGLATIENIQNYYLPGDPTANVEALLVDGEGNYDTYNPLNYGSPLNPDQTPALAESNLARDLRHVAATIRSNVGARFFHVSTGGFDTHSNQEDGFFHSYLLREVSEAIAAFYNEMNRTVSLPAGYLTGNLASKVLIVTFTEFGRTIRQNAPGVNAAGTDHATCTPQFVIGGAVRGVVGGDLSLGQYGAYPALDNPGENVDDLRMTYDFRDFFGTILARWLNVSVSDIGPGPGKIFPTTPADPLGNSYAALTPIDFLAP